MPGQPGEPSGLENIERETTNQAQESGQDQGQFQPQGQPQPQQAPNNQGQPAGTEAPGTPENVSGQPTAQEQAPENQGQPAEVPEEKINNVRQKFGGDRQKVIEGLANLAQRMGHQLDIEKVQQLPDEELYKAYAADEQELGRIRSQSGQNQGQPEGNQELEEMKSRIRAYEQYIAQMQNGFSPGGTPGYGPQQGQTQGRLQGQPRDPRSGQFIPQNQNQAGQESDIDVDLDDFDTDKMLRDEKYVKEYLENQLKKNLSKTYQTVEQRLKQEKEAERQKAIAAQQQQRQMQAWNSQIQQLQKKYGQETFEKYRKAAGLKVQQKPWLATMPNGFDIAFSEVLDENMGKESAYNQQQQNVQNYNQQINQVKQGARMPQSNSHTPSMQQDPYKQMLDNTFGGNYSPDKPFG